ncbi:MAG: hypothetical protein Q6L60_08105 [Thermostichus sp. HHBFW_bins_43]
MPKPEWSRRYRRWALCVVATVLLGLLSGCGPRAPKPIVQQALTYQMSHLSAPVGSLVGSDQLPARLELRDVKIRQDRREPLLLASGEKLEGHHLYGTYTLTVKPPGSRRAYRRQGDPFELTLAHQKAQSQGSETLPERWLLAYRSPDLKTWEIVDFLPQPAPPPELPPADESELAPTGTAPTAREGAPELTPEASTA